jgi:hypothetical protein
MQKCILHIQLTKAPTTRYNQTQDQLSLVSFNGAICHSFYLVDPLTINKILRLCCWEWMPCLIAHKSRIFFIHCYLPQGIIECLMQCLRLTGRTIVSISDHPRKQLLRFDNLILPPSPGMRRRCSGRSTGDLDKLTLKENYGGLDQVHAANGAGMTIKPTRVKLKKDIIVRGKPMNRCKITCGLWHMENILKKNMPIRGRYSEMTNALYHHTCAVGCMHLILSTIVLLHGHFV